MVTESTYAVWYSGFPQSLLADESILSHYNELRTLFTESRDKLVTAEAQIDTPNVLIWAPMAVCSITRRGGEMKTVWRVSSVCSAYSSVTVQTACVFCWQLSDCSDGLCVLLTVQSLFRRSVCSAYSSVTLQTVCVFCLQFSRSSDGLCVLLTVKSLFRWSVCSAYSSVTVQTVCDLLTVQSLFRWSVIC